MLKPRLTQEQEKALDGSDGLIQAESQSGDVILMSMQLYRSLMGVSTDEELAASIATLQKSMQEAKEGKTRPLTEALDDLGKKYEVHG